jgi:hypothetical protein
MVTVSLIFVLKEGEFLSVLNSDSKDSRCLKAYCGRILVAYQKIVVHHLRSFFYFRCTPIAYYILLLILLTYLHCGCLAKDADPSA